jgi:streptogramin lyase
MTAPGEAQGPEYWFGEERVPGYTRPRIAYLDTAGQMVEFPLAEVGWPHSIAVGPEGRAWFPAYKGGVLRALTSIGPGGGIGPRICVERRCELMPGNLTTGPEGDIWFTASQPTSSNGGGGTGLMEMERVANEPGFIGRLTP